MKRDPLESSLGLVFKSLREQKKLKQFVFANALNCSISYYQKLENGNKHFKIKDLNTLCRFWKISLDEAVKRAAELRDKAEK